MKNYLQILRETLKAMLSKPMWLMVVASVCITSLPYMNHTALDLPVAVVDEDHSDVSRELVRLLDSAPKVAVVITTACRRPSATWPGASCTRSS